MIGTHDKTKPMSSNMTKTANQNMTHDKMSTQQETGNTRLKYKIKQQHIPKTYIVFNQLALHN